MPVPGTGCGTCCRAPVPFRERCWQPGWFEIRRLLSFCFAAIPTSFKQYVLPHALTEYGDFGNQIVMDVVKADTMVPVQRDHQQREEIGNTSAGGSFETTAGNNSSHAYDSTDQTSLVGMEEEGAASDGVKTTPMVNKTRKGLSNKAVRSSEGSCRDGSNLQEDWVVDEGEKSQYSDVEEKENGSTDQNKVGLEKAVEGGDLKMREKYAGGKRTKRGGPGSEGDGSLAPGRTTAEREARSSCSPPLSPAASASSSNNPSDAGSRSDHRSSGHGRGDDENVMPAHKVEDNRGRRDAHENSGPGGRVARREERREDPADVVEELTGALDKLLEIEETMTLHRGYAPDNLQKNIGISPRLWDEIYEKARIIPSRGNRLYRSRVRRLVTYLERRLNLPTRLLPYPEEQRREMQEYARGRSSSPARRPSRGQGARDAGDKRDFERRLPSVDRQARDRPGQEEYSRHRVDPPPPRKPAGVDAGASRVAKQMECEEVTPFVAIRNLSRCGSFPRVPPHLSLLLYACHPCVLLSCSGMDFCSHISLFVDVRVWHELYQSIFPNLWRLALEAL